MPRGSLLRQDFYFSRDPNCRKRLRVGGHNSTLSRGGKKVLDPCRDKKCQVAQRSGGGGREEPALWPRILGMAVEGAGERAEIINRMEKNKRFVQ